MITQRSRSQNVIWFEIHFAIAAPRFLNLMKPSCPMCGWSKFSANALRELHPYAGDNPPIGISCPSCGERLRVTAKSRLFAGTLIILHAVAPTYLLIQAGVQLGKWLMALTVFTGLAFYYFVVWPLIVRLKPWSEFQYWLPKSRLVGYGVYLLLPVTIMALLIYVAAKSELGM